MPAALERLRALPQYQVHASNTHMYSCSCVSASASQNWWVLTEKTTKCCFWLCFLLVLCRCAPAVRKYRASPFPEGRPKPPRFTKVWADAEDSGTGCKLLNTLHGYFSLKATSQSAAIFPKAGASAAEWAHSCCRVRSCEDTAEGRAAGARRHGCLQVFLCEAAKLATTSACEVSFTASASAISLREGFMSDARNRDIAATMSGHEAAHLPGGLSKDRALGVRRSSYRPIGHFLSRVLLQMHTVICS